jgi:hypothetical protein
MRHEWRATRSGRARRLWKVFGGIMSAIAQRASPARRSCNRARSKRPRECETGSRREPVRSQLFRFRRSDGRIVLLLSSVVTMPTAMPTVVPVMMPTMMPSHLGRRCLRIILDRRGGARINQRQRLRLLGRCGQNQKRAKCCKTQNFRSVHRCSPSNCGIIQLTLAPCGCPRCNCPARRRLRLVPVT